MPTYVIKYGMKTNGAAQLKQKFDVDIFTMKSYGHKTPVRTKSLTLNVEFISPIIEYGFKKKIWVGTNFKRMNILDRSIPNGKLSNFARGSMIHQILDMTKFKKRIPLYKNDKINFVKLALEDSDMHNYLSRSGFIPSSSYRLDFFLKKDLDSVDFMYSF